MTDIRQSMDFKIESISRYLAKVKPWATKLDEPSGSTRIDRHKMTPMTTPAAVGLAMPPP